MEVPTDDKEVKLAAETPCDHCGLPVGSHPVGDGPYFCCTGCALVYETLNNAGFGATFYELRDLAPSYKAARPARFEIDALQLSEFDTDAFLDEHTRVVDESTREVELFLDGVHCAACVWLVERLPFELAGISKARLDLPRARLTLQYDPSIVQLSDVARWLAKFGYHAYPSRQHGLSQRTHSERRLLMKMGVSWALAGNVMLFAFALYAGLEAARDPTLVIGAKWASLLLALVAVVYGGSEFFRKAWASLRAAWYAKTLERLHMDTPISLGILVGFGHSFWATITGVGEVWFDSITVLIAALLTARWLQMRSRRLAGDASDRVLSLIPTMARRMGEDAAGDLQLMQSATYEVVRAESLRAGEIVQVPAGEVFPVDGVVIAGESTINNAVLTGESRPEQLAAGGRIGAGALNMQAPVWVRVEASGDQTRVGKLLAWIRDQDAKRAPVVLLADRLSGRFVSVLLVVAAITAGIWLTIEPAQATQRVVALLVISCPCALGMATPLAMAVASGRAARRGIFVKSDEAMQQLTGVDVVVLDKTGTLTEGRMTLVAVEGDREALELAGALESQSNHPIAKALCQAAGACRLADAVPTSVVIEPGSGICGVVDHRRVVVGRPEWVYELAEDDKYRENVDRYAGAGYTPVAVSVDGIIVTMLAFGDRIREDAEAMVDFLQRSGKDVYILSGDHSEVVHNVAKALSISSDKAKGHVTPEEKQAFIANLRSRHGRVVTMIGEGVNDAVALQEADIGIAVQGGSTPSLVAADVFLTREGLAPVVEAVTGAGRVMTIIRHNLGFSLAYNILGAGAAVLGLVTPLVAAIAMPISSLVVVGASIVRRSF